MILLKIGSIQTDLQRHASPFEKFIMVSFLYSSALFTTLTVLTELPALPNTIRSSDAAMGGHNARDTPAERRGVSYCQYRVQMMLTHIRHACSSSCLGLVVDDAVRRCTTQSLENSCGPIWKSKSCWPSYSNRYCLTQILSATVLGGHHI